MPKKDIFLTPEGAAKIQEELNYLRDVKRPELSTRLRHAISMGDLSENADYIVTKEEQAFLEGKIQELEVTLREATIIENSGSSNLVDLGCIVRILEDGDEPLEYKIVGAVEANPREGKISNESPLGQALIGKQKGDTVVSSTPAGDISYKILDVRW
jgi:transcription elongation factor GreA